MRGGVTIILITIIRAANAAKKRKTLAKYRYKRLCGCFVLFLRFCGAGTGRKCYNKVTFSITGYNALTKARISQSANPHRMGVYAVITNGRKRYKTLAIALRAPKNKGRNRDFQCDIFAPLQYPCHIGFLCGFEGAF